MGKYLSLDTEATGLEKDCLLINLAFVPVDVTQGIVLEKWGWESLIQCPSFEDLKPNLNDWVVQNLEALIQKAHQEGISLDDCRKGVSKYLNSPEIKEFFKGERPVLLGKSMSALDIPLLNRSLGWDFMQKHFYHHTVDVTCLARSLEDAGVLPGGCTSTTKLMEYFEVSDGKAKHTALSDAFDMAKVYIKLVELIKTKTKS